MLKLMKRLLPGKTYKYLKLVYVSVISQYNMWRFRSIQNQKTIFLMGTPKHDNLGDHAIANAEYLFFRHHFPEYKVVEISTYDFIFYSDALKKYKKDDDIVILSGGGNFGDEYIGEERLRRDVISLFQNNKIVLFPQTIYFTNSERGALEFSISKKIYSSHNNLSIVAREAYSYEILREHFPSNKILLTPDIVFYLNKTNLSSERRGALICLRHDVEGVLSAGKHEQIKQLISEKYGKVVVTDTVTYKNIPIEKREDELLQKWMEFRSAEIVITDRLHGMVFAAITGTPCIVLSNYNYKVKGTYEWIKHLDYIIFEQDLNNVEEDIDRLRKITTPQYDISFAEKYYQTIIDDIKQLE